MSNNRIKVQEKLFTELSEKCTRRGSEVLLKSGSKRYVKASEPDRSYIDYANVLNSILLGRKKSVSYVSVDLSSVMWDESLSISEQVAVNGNYPPSTSAEDDGIEYFIVAIGMGGLSESYWTDLTSVQAGLATYMLSTLSPDPILPWSEVLDVVSLSSSSESGYKGHDSKFKYSGHDPESVHRLFPSVDIIRLAGPLDETAQWSSMLRVCLEDRLESDSWIQADLCSDLIALSDQRISGLPYRDLCMAVMSFDESVLFMSLYRCLEATYAFKSCNDLGLRLDISKKWHELAKELANSIGWRPSEKNSLYDVLDYADDIDLREVGACFNVSVENASAKVVGSRIYDLRNSIVHFRPGLDQQVVSDWNRLCRAMAKVSSSVFSRAYKV